jgi:CRP/FNR family cyclic AMP-dependent transcriptional regulator
MEESPYLKGTMSMIEKFKALPFFHSLGDKFLKQILELSKIRKYINGETITSEGVRDSCIYLIISGHVTIYKKGEQLTILNAVGDTFGELALVDGKPRSATVLAKTDTVCLAVDASFLDAVNSAQQQTFFAVIYRLLAEILAQRLRDTSEELANAKKELEKLRDDTAW